MSSRVLERLTQLATSDAQFSAAAAVHKLAEPSRLPGESETPARHGVDITELLRRLEADAVWSSVDGTTPQD